MHQVKALGAAGKDGLRTEIQGQATDFAEQQLAAETVRAFEHDNISAASNQLVGGSETSHPTTDDSNTHDQAS